MKNDNKLIAEFLGWKIWSSERGRTPTTEYVTLGESPNDYNKELSHLNFCSNWDWLMLVVDKIESLDCVIESRIDRGYIVITAWGKEDFKRIDFSVGEHESKIEATYNACIEFIKWYNEKENKIG